MTRNRKRAVTAFTVTLGGALAVAAAQAQEAAAPVETVEITGSHIRRSEAETAENVQVITAQEIKASGQETVADFLRQMTSTFGNNTNESFSNSFAPGAAMVGLRGFTGADTLVLLNGHRITSYGLFQNLSDSFVDLNVIPVNAVDHVEVLKSGGSAVYGSDAMAGVINIILKHNTTERTAEAGGRVTTEGGATSRDADLLYGFGDYARDNYNVVVSGSVFKRDQLVFSQRANTSSQDYSNLVDGLNLWHVANQFNHGVASTNCGSAAAPGQVISNGIYGPGCYYNDASQIALLPSAQRANFTAVGNLKLGSGLTAFGDVFYSSEKTTNIFTPVTFSSSSFVFNPATGGVLPVSNVLPGSSPAAIGEAPTSIVYAFQNVGPRQLETTSDTYRVTGGLKGNWSGWEWDADYGHSENHVTDSTQNGINGVYLQQNLGTIDFTVPSAADTAGLRINYSQKGITKLDTLELKGSNGVFDLPGGRATVAAGLEFRHESVEDRPSAEVSSGLVLSAGVTTVVASRNVASAFAEFDLPITKTFDVDLAAREEHYSVAGDNQSPQVTLRWQPTREVTIRAVGSHGFRAPSLAEGSNSTSIAHQSASDSLHPVGTPSRPTVGYITGGNPAVKPELSKNFDLGVVFSPSSNANLSVDYYDINVTRVIAPSNTASGLVGYCNANYWNTHSIIDSTCTFSQGTVVRGADGSVIYAESLYTNQFAIRTAGVDINGDMSLPMPTGAKLRLGLDANYVATFQVFDGSMWNEFVANNGWDYLSPISGGGPIPRWRVALSAAWQAPTWTVQTVMHYVDSYANATPAMIANYGVSQPVVASMHTWDLAAEYRGIKNWKFSATVVNLFNRQPPYDSAALNFLPIQTPYDNFTYDDLGRMIDFHVAYSF